MASRANREDRNISNNQKDFREALNYELHAEGESVGDHWMQGVNPKKGALHHQMDIPAGQKISTSKLESAAHGKSPLERKRANLALRYRGE